MYGIHYPDQRKNEIYDLTESFSFGDTKSLFPVPDSPRDSNSRNSNTTNQDKIEQSEQSFIEAQLLDCFYDTFSASVSNATQESFAADPLSATNGTSFNNPRTSWSSGRQFWQAVKQYRDSIQQLPDHTVSLETLRNQSTARDEETTSSPMMVENIVYNPREQQQSDSNTISNSLQTKPTRNQQHPHHLAIFTPTKKQPQLQLQQKEESQLVVPLHVGGNTNASGATIFDHPDSSRLTSIEDQQQEYLKSMFYQPAVLGHPPRYGWDRLQIVYTLSYFLPRYYYQRVMRTLSRGSIYCDRRTQWVFAAIFNILFVFFLIFFVAFTNIFRSQSMGRLRIFEIVYFFFFIVGSSIIRTALKRTGLALDRRKLGTVSMFFVAEYMGLLFYYTFYRVLFESINSWELFFFFQIIHLLSEWMMYPLRGSRMLMQFVASIEFSCLPTGLVEVLPSIIPKGTDDQDWVNFIALDFGVRVVVMIASSFGMLLLLITIDYVPWIDNGLRQTSKAEISQNSTFLLVAVSLEAVNALLMDQWFFRHLQINVMDKVKNCFSNLRFSVLVVLIGTLLFLNPVYAFTTNNIY